LQRRAGESGSKADEAAHAAALRPEANRQRAAPAMLAAPAPQPTHTRRAAAGRVFPLGRSCGPATMLAGLALTQRPPPLSSLHDTRHRSCTGSRLLAALPALDALRHCSGTAAAAGSSQRLRTIRKRPPCPALILRITWLQLYAIAKAIGVQRLLHSYNSCYTHNRAGQASGSKRPRATSCSGKAAVPALSGAARSCCTLLQQHGPGFGQWSAASRPAAAARCCSSTGRARQGGALARPRRPRPPAHPAQAAEKPGLSARLPCCCSQLRFHALERKPTCIGAPRGIPIVVSLHKLRKEPLRDRLDDLKKASGKGFGLLVKMFVGIGGIFHDFTSVSAKA
jgi:hypothetical protein